ncbi:MAG: ATP-binding protein [Candidatus Omnitrophica bacterium]|nr:ATP-binding protein [Candidatus Omnitrophota bacterium]
MKKFSIDWRLAGGFSALLLLIIALGMVGIVQIQSLSRQIDQLGMRYFPLQKATMEMRINNSLYAMGIRNFVFWKSSRYLEAARSSSDSGTIDAAQEEFDRQLAIYASHFQSSEQKQWIEKIAASEKQLRLIGSRIVQLTETGAEPDAINKLLMTFESSLYRIDDFIDNTVQEFNLQAIEEQLRAANSRKQRAILLLQWSLVLGVFIGAETAWFVYRNRKRERERREQLVKRMIKVEEEQRQDLSLQVHNEMGQDLSAVKIYLDLINNKLTAKSPEIKKYISQGKQILTGLLNKSHNIVELLRPPALEEIGLVDTISGLIVQYKQISSIEITYHKPQQEIKLAAEYSLILYRTAQEALTNVVTHSQAQNVEIILCKDRQSVKLTISDDGRGFNYRGYRPQPRRRQQDRLKLGLVGLHERIELLGGKMKVDTAPGKGTCLSVELNLTKT